MKTDITIAEEPFLPRFLHKIYTACRRVYTRFYYSSYNPLVYEKDPNVANDRIYELLKSGKPCMIARFGANELITVFNYLGITEHRGDAWGYITRKNGPWWWNETMLWQLEHAAGFFPITDDSVSRFCQLMLKDATEVDILGSWLKEETAITDLLKNAYKVALPYLEPWFAEAPWSKALEGKKVLVIHSFDELIKQQYEKRNHLFSKEILPSFAALYTIKAVQSYGENSKTCGFKSWFDALQWMEDEMDKLDYDVCILGCGAYGFPLAAHAKRMGKQAIHLGGVSQVLFGITGSRWLDPMHRVKEWNIPVNYYASLANEYWVRPGEATKPSQANQIEGACYW
jgi:hypothetical protein